MNAIVISPFDKINKTVTFRLLKTNEPETGAVIQSDSGDFYKVEEITNRNPSFEKGCYLATCIVEKLN